MRDWFADVDEDAREPYIWSPFLQINGGVMQGQVWFRSEEDCERFIQEEVR